MNNENEILESISDIRVRLFNLEKDVRESLNTKLIRDKCYVFKNVNTQSALVYKFLRMTEDNESFRVRSVSKKEFNLKVSNYSAHEITSRTIDEMFDNLTYKIEVLR